MAKKAARAEPPPLVAPVSGKSAVPTFPGLAKPPEPAAPTFEPRVKAQSFTVIVCTFCAAPRPSVVATRPEQRRRTYECSACVLCPTCGTWNKLVKLGRVHECRRCRQHDGDTGTLFRPEHGSRFKVPEKGPEFRT